MYQLNGAMLSHTYGGWATFCRADKLNLLGQARWDSGSVVEHKRAASRFVMSRLHFRFTIPLLSPVGYLASS